LSKAESVIFFDVIFILLLSAFGFSTTGGSGFTALQTIQQPTLAPLPEAIKCNPIDFICAGTKDVATATAYVGWAIVNAPVLAIYYLIVAVTFSNIVLSIAFAPQLSVQGIPYFGLIFFGLQTYIIFEALRFFRGLSGSAGV
jgi:hypothetical protein